MWRHQIVLLTSKETFLDAPTKFRFIALILPLLGLRREAQGTPQAQTEWGWPMSYLYCLLCRIVSSSLVVYLEAFGNIWTKLDNSETSTFRRNMECKCSANGCFQILWKSHKNIGCGLTIATEIGRDRVRTVVVAIYEPARFRLDIDDYIENILPPKLPWGNGS